MIGLFSGFLSFLASIALGSADEPTFTIAEIVKCRSGFKGLSESIMGTVASCKQELQVKDGEHLSDLCSNLCLWNKLDYLVRDADGKATGYKKENIRKVSEQLYSEASSVDGKTNDFTSCFDSVSPKPSFTMNGKCDDLKGFNTCYRGKMVAACKKA